MITSGSMKPNKKPAPVQNVLSTAIDNYLMEKKTMETTHKIDETSRYRQIVTPETLKAVLDQAGDDYSRPDFMTDEDEWDVAE
jgi:hypothetical protein